MFDVLSYAKNDPVSTREAACLWEGIDPILFRWLNPEGLTPEEESRLNLRMKFLEAAIVSGDLPTSKPFLLPDWAYIWRSVLTEYAIEKGERPLFLFGAVQAPLPAKLTEDIATTPNPAESQTKRRRPTEIDREAFQEWADRKIADTGIAPGRLEAENFAKSRNLARDWGREMLKTIPKEKRQKAGNPGRTAGYGKLSRI